MKMKTPAALVKKAVSDMTTCADLSRLEAALLRGEPLALSVVAQSHVARVIEADVNRLRKSAIYVLTTELPKLREVPAEVFDWLSDAPPGYITLPGGSPQGTWTAKRLDFATLAAEGKRNVLGTLVSRPV